MHIYRYSIKLYISLVLLLSVIRYSSMTFNRVVLVHTLVTDEQTTTSSTHFDQVVHSY